MNRRRQNEEQGRFAEEVVADHFDLEHRPDETEWYDAVNPRTGTKYEVKSTHVELDSSATGRFRLWEDQHRSLAASDGQATAWYAFVLLENGDVKEIRRMRPSTVTSLIHEGGGSWNRAGHQERDSAQHKLPWEMVFSRT
jgi:hypothetical protein